MSSFEALGGPAQPPETRYVISRDGSPISYLSLGSGPSVITVPGALSTASDYLQFACGLSDRFTVHIVERRGRGASAPQGDAYGIGTECDDVLAVQEETGARFLVGHSFGGLVALETVARSGAFRKVAVYEPGISVDGSIPMGWLPRYEKYLADGKDLDAFVTFSQGTGPDHARKAPRWLMKMLIPRFVSSEKRSKMFALLQQNMVEHREIGKADNSYRNYDRINAPVLLMSGGRTGIGWVGQAISRLSETLPHTGCIQFPALDHFGIDQGSPAEVAHAVGDFFANQVQPSAND